METRDTQGIIPVFKELQTNKMKKQRSITVSSPFAFIYLFMQEIC